MSTHPNAILMLRLTPEDLARKTYRAILSECGVSDPDGHEIQISGKGYSFRMMEDDYYESSQISAKEGDIVLWDLVTYGYGETITWSKLESQKNDLEEWAKQICAKHLCTYEILVSANYW